MRKIIVILFIAIIPIAIYAQSFDELMSSAQHEIDLWNPDKAIDFLNKAEALNSENARLYFLRGMAKSDNSDKEGAIVDLDRAIELNPDDSLSYYERGRLRDYTYDYQGAVEDFTKFLEFVPGDIYAIV